MTTMKSLVLAFGRRDATGRLLGRSPALGQDIHTNATLRSFSTRAKPGA